MKTSDGPSSLAERIAPWIALAALVLGAALRIVGSDSQLWYDEIETLVDSVRQPLVDLVTHFPSNNNHVLYSVLANLSISVFGEHPWSVRLPAIVFGIASIPLLYVLGKAVTSRFEAASAALLMALSYHHLWYTQNARGYTILLCVGLLTTHLALKGLRERRLAPWLMFGVVAAFGAYTHLTMVLATVGMAAIVGLHLLATRRGFKLDDWTLPAAGFFAAAVATVALYAPLLGDIQAFFGDTSQGVKAASPLWALSELGRGLQVGYATGAVVLVAAIVFLAGCWSYLRQGPTVLALFLAPGLLVFATSALMQRPTFPRFFFFMAGFILLIVVRGALTITELVRARLGSFGEALRPWAPLAAVTAMALVSMVILPRNYGGPKQDFAGALGYINARARPADLVATVGGGATQVYRGYYGRSWNRLSGVPELTASRATHAQVWVVRTFERYVRKDEGALFAALETTCDPAVTFPGTLADGDVLVSRCGPLP